MLAAVGLAPGAKADTKGVVYTAHDRNWSAPRLRECAAQPGNKVRAQDDTAAPNTVGRVNASRFAKDHPRGDVCRNNQSGNTIALDCGPAAPHPMAAAKGATRPTFRDPKDRATGCAARARRAAG